MAAHANGQPVSKKRKLSRPPGDATPIKSPQTTDLLPEPSLVTPVGALNNQAQPDTYNSAVAVDSQSALGSRLKRSARLNPTQQLNSLGTPDGRVLQMQVDSAVERSRFPSGKRKGRPRKSDILPLEEQGSSSPNPARPKNFKNNSTSEPNNVKAEPDTQIKKPIESPEVIDTRKRHPSGRPMGRPRKGERLNAPPKLSNNGKLTSTGQEEENRIQATRTKSRRAQLRKENAPDFAIVGDAANGQSGKPLKPGPKRFKLKFETRPVGPIVTRPAHLPKETAFTSFASYLDSFVSLDEDVDQEAASHRRAMRKSLKSRIEAAKVQGLLAASERSQWLSFKASEPSIPQRFQDHLNAHACYFSKLMHEERKRNHAVARKIAGMIQMHFKRQASAGERLDLERQKVLRQVAKRTANEVRRKWRMAEREVLRRISERIQEEQRAAGKEHLNQILQQSTDLLDSRTNFALEPGYLSSDHVPVEDDEEEDHYLSVEQLRSKYENIPDLVSIDSDRETSAENEDEAEENGDEISVAHSAHTEGRANDSDGSGTDSPMDSEMDSDSSNDTDQTSTSGEELGLRALYPEFVRATALPQKNNSRDLVYPSGTKDESSPLAVEMKRIASRLNNSQVEELVELHSDDEIHDATDDDPMDSELDESMAQSSSDGTDRSPSPGLDWLYKGDIRKDKAPTNQVDAEAPLVPTEPISPNHVSDKAEMAHNAKQPISVKTPIPPLLRGTLREYQHKGLDWMAGLYMNGTNGILADEMGLGKTIQTISLLAWLACEQQVWGTHLIVVPTSVMLNWETEFKKFAPGLKVLTYYGNPKERKEKRRGWSRPDTVHVVITSYQLIITDAPVFRRKSWEYMVLDEAHNIKNFKSQRWQTLLNFNTQHRLLLTGTPLQNNLNELWSLLYFLMPQGLSDSAGFANLVEFQEWFARPVDKLVEDGAHSNKQARETITKLHTILRPYILRRLKADVEKQMPGKFEHVVSCKLSKRQRFLYDDFMSRSGTRAIMASGNFLSIINCFMQLRKVCNHPDLFETRPIVTSLALSSSLVSACRSRYDLIQRQLKLSHQLSEDLDFLNLRLTSMEQVPKHLATRISELGLNEPDSLEDEPHKPVQDSCSSISKKTLFQEDALYWSGRLRKAHSSYINRMRCQRVPVFGLNLVAFLRLRPGDYSYGISALPNVLDILRPSLQGVSEILRPLVTKFACLTPKVVALDLRKAIMPNAPFANTDINNYSDVTYFARTATSIIFPDKRLLQFDCGKLQKLAILLRDLILDGHRILIFTQMTKMLDILEQFLNIHGYLYFRLDGSTKIEARQSLTERFNSDLRVPVFILSTRSGGLGINLTGADTVIFYDSDWNPCMDRQCQDRAHRIGQTRDVHIYRFVSEYTIEQNIMRKANQKRLLDDIVIGEGDFTTDFFNRVDWKDMLGDEISVNFTQPPGTEIEQALAAAEDEDDAQAARIAEKEMDIDAIEFAETGVPQDDAPSQENGKTADVPMEDPEDAIGSIDDYMITFIERERFTVINGTTQIGTTQL